MCSCACAACRRSHQTAPALPPPTPPGFALDFAQLVQATLAPARRGARGQVGREGAGEGAGKEGRRRAREQIVEEEEGWDLVEA